MHHRSSINFFSFRSTKCISASTPFSLDTGNSLCGHWMQLVINGIQPVDRACTTPTPAGFDVPDENCLVEFRVFGVCWRPLRDPSAISHHSDSNSLMPLFRQQKVQALHRSLVQPSIPSDELLCCFRPKARAAALLAVPG